MWHSRPRLCSPVRSANSRTAEGGCATLTIPSPSAIIALSEGPGLVQATQRSFRSGNIPGLVWASVLEEPQMVAPRSASCAPGACLRSAILLLLAAAFSPSWAEDKGPRQLSPVFEERQGGVRIVTNGPSGFPWALQFFSLNPTTKACGVHQHSRLSCPVYENAIIDSARLSSQKRLGVGELVLTTNERECAGIKILFERHRKAFISPEYLVSPGVPGEPGVPAGQDRIVVVYFDPRSGPDSPLRGATGTLVVRRNGEVVTRLVLDPAKVTCSKLDFYDTAALPLDKTGFPAVELKDVKRQNDVVDWEIAVDGKATHSGLVAFPVIGTVSALVGYEVRILDHPKP